MAKIYSITARPKTMTLWLFLFMFISLWMSQRSYVILAEKSTFIFRPGSEMADYIGGVVFDSPARSFLHCSAMCAQTCCQRFTYSLETGTRRCRGYSRHIKATTLISVGARTQAWNRNMQGVPSNVSYKKTATQSSTYTWFNIRQEAHLAVDGRTNTDFKDLSCTHTMDNEAAGSWWQVDLQGQYVVYSVLITNRGDCCSERLRDFTVRVYREDPTSNVSDILCYNFIGPMRLGVTEELPCYRPTTGRFVRVTNTPNVALTLCEVQVMAVPVF